MQILSLVAKPSEKDLLPSMLLEVEIGRIRHGEAIVNVNGWLETDDEKTVARLVEEPSDQLPEEDIGAKDTAFDKDFKETTYKTVIGALLDRRALDHIEQRRAVDKKGDVKLNAQVSVTYVASKALVSHSFLMDPRQYRLQPLRIPVGRGMEEEKIVVYAYDPEFSSQHRNRWIISGSGSPIFLSISKQTFKKDLRIPSTDWIHDYSPKLGLGEYFVVEIPKGRQAIKEAWGYIQNAEESFRRWNTKGVFANCREAGFLLNRLAESKFEKGSFSREVLWGRTYGRFENLASTDLHLEEFKKSSRYAEEDIGVGREDAEHLLILTKALVKYAEELLGKE